MVLLVTRVALNIISTIVICHRASMVSMPNISMVAIRVLCLCSWKQVAVLGSSEMFNVGVDFSFLNRFYGSLDYFYKTSDGLLYKYPLAEQNGLLNITMNAAKVANHGWELMLGANVLKNLQ